MKSEECMKSALIAALVAAMVSATAATATATGLITGKQIKNGSIGLVDLSGSAKRSLKGQRGPVGPQGPQGIPGLNGLNGAQGAQGIQGIPGGFDPAKVTYVFGSVVTVAPGTSDVSTALCPAGSKVIGGGFYSDAWLDGGLYVTDQGPLTDGTGWSIDFYNSVNALGNAFIQAYAVCASK
jgi:hypothetical protein